MRFLSPIKQRVQRKFTDGFTLIEILVIAPIVILIISGFIALMVSMVGDVLVTRDQNNLSFETQDALNRIEQDTRLTTQFLSTSGTFTAPQGSDSNFTGTAAFTASSNLLIMGGITTDQNPANNARQAVYYAGQPYACGSQQTYNRVFQEKVMYFLYNGSLWRRAVLPTYDTNSPIDDNTVCSVPWQENTCQPGYSLSTRCQTNDSEVMKNVSSFNVQYLSSPSSSTDLGASNALSASSIAVTLNGQKTTAGRTVTSSGSMRATKLNSIDVDIPAPSTTPTVTATVSGPSVTFNWTSVPLASSYVIQYNINGGSWNNATTNSLTTTYTVNTSRGNTVTFQVAAKNSAGTSPYGSATGTIPLWYTCNLQAGWVDYGSPYAGNEYTKTSNDLVMLHGLIRGGTTTAGTVICILPAAYRPSARLTFHTIAAGAASRIDVFPTGEVMLGVVGGNGWLVLDGITFMASTSNISWTNLSLVNSWSAYGGGFATPQYGLDASGRVEIQGLANRTTSITNSTIATLPTAFKPNLNMFVMANSNSNAFEVMTIDSAGNLANAFTNSNYFSTQATYYPYTYAGWTNLTLQNGWVNFGSNWDTAQYTKSADGVVTIKGLIKNGTASAGTLVATLPVGYRPLATTIMTLEGANTYARIDLQPTGQLYIDTANSTFTNLNFSFIAEQ